MKDTVTTQIRPVEAEERSASTPLSVCPVSMPGGGQRQFWYAHVGSSMNPALREFDLLEIEPYGGRPVRVGDVIAFTPPAGEQPVVHRVVQITPDGIRTRGDSNWKNDPWALVPTDISGRVVFAWRGQKRRRVAGALTGRLLSRLSGCQRASVEGASRLLGPAYGWLVRWGVIRRLLPNRFGPRVVQFATASRKRLILLLGRRVVGRYDARQRQWLIRRPFRLLVDQGSLPKGPSKPSRRRNDGGTGEEIPAHIKGSKTSALLTTAMQDIHAGLKLAGKPRNALLHVHEDLLSYVWSLLKDESPAPPDASAEDWSDLLSILGSHWILPLLHWRIGSLPPELAPPESVVRQMRTASLEGRAASLRSEQQLGEILHAFHDEGVRSLVLRGPALGWQAYPDPALRGGSDLDLLVRPEHMLHARAILERLGYRCLGKRFEVARDFFRDEDFVHEKHPGRKLVVDVHWSHWELHPFLSSGADTDIGELFGRAVKVQTPGLTFETLHPADALIHAAIHLGIIHSRDVRLIWIYDIALLARCLRAPEDWRVLQERSVAWRGRLALETCLRMAQLWCGLHLPDGFKDFRAWPRPTADELAVWSHAVRDHWMAFLLKRYLCRPSGLPEAARSVLHVLFPHRDIVRYCYPPSRGWLLPLSYVRRWHTWFRELVAPRLGLCTRRSALSGD